MSFLGTLLRPLRLPETIGLDLDAPATTLIHRDIIRRKPFLENLYRDWYRCMGRLDGGIRGQRLEIGSGGGFIKEILPETETSDVLPLPYLDHVLSGKELPFPEESLAAVYMLNTLHHVPDPLQLLGEVQRCLKPGGRMICIEPAPTWWGRLVYTWIHHEPCDLTAGLTLERSDGPLSQSNSALPWIIFVRELDTFRATYPDLALIALTYHTPISYLLSGGVSFRSLVPAASFPWIRRLEEALDPWSHQLGMFMTLVLEKR